MLIAQITDFHVQAGRQPVGGRFDTASALDAAVAHLNALDPRPDVVLATGDLVNDGTDDDYGVLAEILSALKSPCLPIPGNHDDRGALLRALGRQHPSIARCEDWIHYAVEDWPICLVGLDTLEDGQSWGRLCARRLAWLDATLARLGDTETVVFLHHPPFQTGIAHMDAIGLRAGRDALAQLVRPRPNVLGLLSGHVHRPIQTCWAGTLASTAPATGHQIALDLHAGRPSGYVLEPPACHLHTRSSTAGLVTHMSYIGRFDGPFPFRSDPTESV